MKMIYKGEGPMPDVEVGDKVAYDVYHDGQKIGRREIIVEEVKDREAGGGGSFVSLYDTDGVSHLIGYFDSSVIIERKVSDEA